MGHALGGMIALKYTIDYPADVSRLIVLDARPTSDWLIERVPGAVPVPYYDIAPIVERLPRDGTWIVAYCACPHAASDFVVDNLREQGFDDDEIEVRPLQVQDLLAREWAPHGIRVCAVAPGRVDSPPISRIAAPSSSIRSPWRMASSERCVRSAWVAPWQPISMPATSTPIAVNT